MLTLYGIPNCGKVKKARAWQDERGTAYADYDYKRAGVAEADLRRWIDALVWETVLNRAGTTFRKLPDAEKADMGADKAVALLLAQPSMITRPLVEGDGALLVG